METTTSVDFSEIAPYKPRTFLPESVNFNDTEELTHYFKILLDRPIHSTEELNQWLLDRSELEAAFSQHGAVLYIRMTCQTDDQARAQAYKNFIETVVPAVKPLGDELNKKYLKERGRFSVDANRYEVYERALRTDVELFREDNIPLQTQVDVLAQEYQTLCGAMTVTFNGKERTLPQMNKFLQEPDRALRESAWRALSARRVKEREKLDGLYDEMLKLRHTIAQNAGCANFVEYQFRAFHRFDYSPAECKQYHATIERRAVPLLKEMYRTRRAEMKLGVLRPWDLSVDPLGRPALNPFSSVEEFLNKTSLVFERLDPELRRQFELLRRERLLDLANRKGRAPGGYQQTLAEARKPFIFMNAVGLNSDVRTLFHECGHAFHALACAGDELVDYRHAPLEFSEVASMSMEILTAPLSNAFYGPGDLKRALRDLWEDIVEILVWVAVVDCFQHWIYENPAHTAPERAAAWVKIYQRFGSDEVDWSGFDEIRSSIWHRQLHIFEMPFYYIEYGIAQLGALQLWQATLKNPTRTLANYRRALALGGSKPLPQLYQAAGIQFRFDESVIGPLLDSVRAAWRDIGDSRL